MLRAHPLPLLGEPLHRRLHLGLFLWGQLIQLLLEGLQRPLERVPRLPGLGRLRRRWAMDTVASVAKVYFRSRSRLLKSSVHMGRFAGMGGR